MSSSQASYRGVLQAQGDDITKKGGYTSSWAEDKPITDEERDYHFLLRFKKSAVTLKK